MNARNPAAIAWLIANGVALLLLLLVLGGWARSQPQVRRHAIAGTVCVTLALALLLMLFKSTDVPTGWITVLMEGGSIRNVQQLYGQGAHFGRGFYFLAYWLCGHDVTTLPAVVHANLCLAAIKTIIFFFLASYVLRSWWTGLLFALGYVCNLSTLHAAFSETPAMLWATHFWLGCVAAAVIDDDANTTIRLRWLAFLCLALLAVLATLLRGEFVVLAAPAVAVALVKLVGGEPALRQAARSGGRFLGAIVAGPFSVFLLVAGALALWELVPWPEGTVGWAIAGLRPLNLSFLNMESTLAVILPLGLVALFVLGMVHATRQWVSFLLLPVALLILVKVYTRASHGVLFERLRYLTFLTPAVLLVSLFGFRELSGWAQRWTWPPWWKRLAVLLLLMTLTIWRVPGPKEIFRRRHQLPGVATSELLLGWNQQTEVRYLVDLVARYPRCAFLVKVAPNGWVVGDKTGYQWTAFGAPISRYHVRPNIDGSLEQVATQLAPGAACVFFYRSLDCDLIGFTGCEAETQGRAALEERVLENLPYSDITEYGAHHAQIRLGLYPVMLPGGGEQAP